MTTGNPGIAMLTAIIAAMAAQVGVAGAPPMYEATVLPQIDDTDDPDVLTYTWATALNDARTIVGELGNELGFVWTPDEGGEWLQPMFPDTADAAVATSVNEAGDVAGTYRPDGGTIFDISPFHLAADGTFSPLPSLAGDSEAGVADLNDNGMLVGSSGNTSVYWVERDGRFEIFEIGGLGGFVSGAAAVNNNDVVVGNSNTPDMQAIQPYKWTVEGGFEPLPQLTPGVASSASDINDRGLAVGRGGVTNFQNKAVYWDAEGEIHELPSIAENPVDIGVLAVNNSGVMVGHELNPATFSPEARLWIEDEVYHLQDLATGIPDGHTLARATDINDNDDIAVQTSVDGEPEQVTVLLTPVEPGIPGDLDGDGDVDSTDLNMVLGDFGCTGGGCAGDADGDGDTDSEDLNAVLGAFGVGG